MDRGAIIFKSVSDFDAFYQNGYVLFHHLIGADEINELEKLFEQYYHTRLEEGFYSSLMLHDPVKRRAISNRITSILMPFINKVCQNHRAYLAAFMFKIPTNKLTVDTHQDWTYVNEKTNISFNCWIPLCDTDVTNGGLCMLPGTQYQFLETYRTPNIPFFYQGNEDVPLEYLIPVYAKKGDAVFFDNSILHASTSNTSALNRKAIVVCLKQEGAQMIFLNGDAKNRAINIYRQEDDYIFKFDDILTDTKHAPKTGQKIGTIELSKNIVYQREELYEIFEDAHKSTHNTKCDFLKNHIIASSLSKENTDKINKSRINTNYIINKIKKIF